MSLLTILSGVDADHPELHRKWTQSEELYFLFKVSRNPAVQQDCRGRLAAICIKAVGHLVPPWKGKWNPNFDALRYKARAPWVYHWLDKQLAVPQGDLCRYIGRRCYFALVDEIRQATRRHHVKPETEEAPIAPLTANEILEQRQELMAALGKHTRYATKSSELTAEERLLAFDSIMAGKPLTNVEVAKQWGCSEGKVRNVRKSLLKKWKLGKKQRTRHYDEKETKIRRAERQAKEEAAKKYGVKDEVYWDKKPDGTPLESTRK